MSTNDRSVRVGGIDWPEPLIDALLEDRLVVFAGAGVSMGAPAHLPSVRDLVEAVLHGTGETIRSDEPLEMQLGILEAEDIDVRGRAARILKSAEPTPTTLHRDLLRLFSDVNRVRVITTNYDDLFEQAAVNGPFEDLKVYNAPALPADGNFSGIVHVHGHWNQPEHMVLTGTDYGRAYLIQGRSRDLIANVFADSVVLFIGYSHSDIVVSYLASASGSHAESHRYVLTPDENLRRWAALRTTPIVYNPESDHRILRESVDALADFANLSEADWEWAIRRILASGLSKTTEEEDLVIQALKVPSRALAFTKSADEPDWIAWLDTRNYLSGLFKELELGRPESILSYWIANSHALQHPDAVFDLFAKHSGAMNSRFWVNIAQAMSNPINPKIGNPVVRRWASTLVSRSPEYLNEYVAVSLIETYEARGDLTNEFFVTSRAHDRKQDPGQNSLPNQFSPFHIPSRRRSCLGVENDVG